MFSEKMIRRQSQFLAATMLLIALAMSLPAIADPLINNPDAEAAIQLEEKLNETMASSLHPHRLKSPSRAFLLSAVIPGTGEFYAGAKRGVLFVAAEVAFWTTYFVLHGQAEDIKEEYVDFVDSHIVFEEDSPVNSTETWTLEDYEHATQSDNWHYTYTDNNGKPIDRVGKYYWDDLPQDLIHESGEVSLSESQSPARVEAYSKRESMNSRFKLAKTFLGLVILNHVVSAVDARIAAAIHNDRISEISLHPTISPSGYLGAYLTLHRKF
jgi:hypothetical protein